MEICSKYPSCPECGTAIVESLEGCESSGCFCSSVDCDFSCEDCV